MKSKLILFIICILLWASCVVYETEVAICSSIHGLHKSNTNYTYEHLFNYIHDFNPDIIGVEIRQEDIDSSTTYLKNYYPFEMYEILEQNKSKMVLGTDWLGTSIKGKPIPQNYFNNLEVIQLSNKANADSIFQTSLVKLNKIAELKDNITKNSSIAELNDGRYDALNSQYYELLDSLYLGTPYQRIAEFYKMRDTKITERILEIVDQNRGKKMIFILGADHRSHAIESFIKMYKNEPNVKLLSIN